MNSKFRGTLLGVLVGDCCGSVFEGEVFDAGQRLVLKNFLSKLQGEYFPSPQLKFTDDTAMTKSVAKCLLDYDESTYQKSLAVNFVKEYFNSPSRGYGASVSELFHQLRRNKFADVLIANKQFNGFGSFGNGAAMRISPVALYCLNHSEEFLIELVRKTSVITHSNILAVNGAVLQCLAVRQSLKMDSADGLNANKFVDQLIDRFTKIEKGEDEYGIPEEKAFTKQLKVVKTLLNKEYPPSEDEVRNKLGHSNNALYSVPTSIYSFLRTGHSPYSLNETLEYTLGIGGDSDTIGSMACSLLGALHGDKSFSKNLLKHCESSEEIVEVADQLYKVAAA